MKSALVRRRPRRCDPEGLVNVSWAMKNIPEGLKPAILLTLFGTTEVVPFQNTVYSASSRD